MPKMKIAVLGSHGSGKTTFIEFMRKKLEAQGKRVDVKIMGWKQFHNPLLRLFSDIYLSSKTKKQDKSERLERFRERSLFFYLIYYMELLTRYFKLSRLKADFILMDRYFYEELMFMEGVKYKIFKKITPKPDLAIALLADIKTIRQRGHIVSENKLNNFHAHLKMLNNDFPMIFIDSSNPLDKIYDDIKPYIKYKNDN